MTDKNHPLNVLNNESKLNELRAALANNPDKTVETVVSRALDLNLSEDQKIVRERVIETLQAIYDPELPVNIYDLGLIYKIDVDPDFNVAIQMTLTAPACPVAGTLPGEIQNKVQKTPGVNSAKVELVWEPPWSKDRMSEAALLELGLI